MRGRARGPDSDWKHFVVFLERIMNLGMGLSRAISQATAILYCFSYLMRPNPSSRECRHLPILAAGVLIDMVSMRDLLFVELEEREAEVEALRKYIGGTY